jgi:hypothetical protein
MRRYFLLPLAKLLMVVTVACFVPLAGCDVDVDDEGPVEEMVDGDDGLDVDIDPVD